MAPWWRRAARENVLGDWYTTGECLACGAPESVAPALFAPLTDSNFTTYFIQQPRTPADVALACRAARVCCTAAVRYGGREPAVLELLQDLPECTDHVLTKEGRVVRRRR